MRSVSLILPPGRAGASIAIFAIVAAGSPVYICAQAATDLPDLTRSKGLLPKFPLWPYGTHESSNPPFLRGLGCLGVAWNPKGRLVCKQTLEVRVIRCVSCSQRIVLEHPWLTAYSQI